MKTALSVISIFLLLLLSAHALFAEPQIKLIGRKDLVLSKESRQTVIEVARRYLSEKSEAFMTKAQQAQTPYSFVQQAVAVVRENGEIVERVQEATFHYDDDSVLRAVSQSFANQVSGTLGRGSTRFLQLKGGRMIQPDTSFPVSIPQAQKQTFIVTIAEITSDGYTLKLGEATQTMSLNASSGSHSGAIKFE